MFLPHVVIHLQSTLERSCATEQELECFCTLRNTCMHFVESRQIPDNTEISLPDVKLEMGSNLESLKV